MPWQGLQFNTMCEIFKVQGASPFTLQCPRYERPKKVVLIESNSGSIFAVCGPNFTPYRYGSDGGLQYRFPLYNIFLHSGDIRDEVAS